ncbi:bifunctional UDP-N-acetylglucosamine diphosphorylase/glucosamine-1-phosphate N-acetyltransferase GlmU [Flavimaricola marinus]|uniref:Bifunctional protein GlmU n=1 Tax=Flavimaricola marinus TaxID=1819565 RepID=A0A238LE00_9RHOB|nr:bifunctional UDP-N-acetylglucosamine diphosphorylase/glucosamine-1-phosphate N-acetyltransferase GlmU [Flavimaricola marinus]SMY07773.1 Bifunctional protein GlmU [Flavimaricola marinus]
MTAISAIILAAGQGSRMNSDLPKVLHEIGNAPLLVHAMTSAAALSPDRTVVVTGVGGDLVDAAAKAHDETALCVRQTEQLGTGHAVLAAKEAMDGAPGDAVVLYGDTPFIRAETLEAMQSAREHYDVVVLGFDVYDVSARYGRLVTHADELTEIVEFKDADAATRAITLCNSGVVMANAATLYLLLDAVGNNNASEEYYLTDIVGIARSKGLSATVVRCDEAETLGINTRAELARAEAAFQSRARDAAMEDGVTLVAPDTVFFSLDTYIGRDAVIEPNVIFGPGVTIESEARIRSFSHLEGCHVSRGSIVGPFARLRPGAELAENVRIGNFVEVKNAQVAEGAKINHLTYVGDADVGARTNIGAGTVTCNYDGVFKHRTVIGKDAFIGSNTLLVAPVTVGDNAMTATGTIVTRDVPASDLAIGRARQENKPGLAVRLFEKLKAAKAAKQKGAE